MLALKAVLPFAFLEYVLAAHDSYLRKNRKPPQSPTEKASSVRFTENPDVLVKGSYSSSSIGDHPDMAGEGGHVVYPIIEACRRCDMAEAKRILEEDPNAVKVMNWKALHGLAATAQSKQCLALLEYIISTIRFPQNIMVGTLSTASYYSRPEAFEILFDNMLELRYTLSSLSFSLLCDFITPSMLHYLLDSKTISKKLIAAAVQHILQTGRVEILHILMQHLDEESVFGLVPSILHSVRSIGCPEGLESLFRNLFFKNSVLVHAKYFAKLANDMIKKSLRYPKSTEYSKTVDVLLRVSFIADSVCSSSYLHQAVTEGHIDLGLVLRRRCPHTLSTLNIKYFVDAMKKEWAAEVFEAFADIFVMSGTEYKETFLAALHHLDRSLTATIYEWAKSNDYFLGLDVRMAAVDLAIKKLSSPEKFFDPAIYQQQQQFLQLALTKTKELNQLKEQLDENPHDQIIAMEVRRVNKVIADAYAMVMSLKIDPEVQQSINYFCRRLLTFVYTESASLPQLKQMAKTLGMSKMLKYLNRCSLKPGDPPKSEEEPEEFKWYQ